ncbi:MAG: MSHA biogenesis protein MshI [Lentisphaeria bacterium]
MGIEMMADGLAIVARGCHGDSSQINAISMIRDDAADGDQTKALTEFIEKNKLAKRLCHVVLGAQDYQLLLVEPPDVPEEDVREAIRWRIKDLVSIPVASAVIDVFSLPADGNRSTKKMLYVVVAEIGRIKSLIAMVKAAGLTLASIDIGEMALRNLALVKSGGQDDSRGVAIARIAEGGGTLALYKKGNLYLSRQFKLTYGGGLLDDLPGDMLALEIQRSLDYYERQMGMAPPAQLFLCGENISADKITQNITRSLNVPTQFLELSLELGLAEDVDDGMVQLCLGALGGAYREALLQ